MTTLNAALADRIRKARGKFLAMAATYFLGAFNDNFYKQAMSLLAIGAALTHYQGYAAVVFTLPFVVFSAPSGWLADRYPKRRTVIGSKALELVAMSFGAAGILFLNWPLAFVMLAIMALQSTIFGPALNGSIPELYPAEYVTKANGLVKMATTAAILSGIALAGIVLDVQGTGPSGVPAGRFAVACAVVAVSLVGLVASFFVPSRPAAAPEKPFPWEGPLKSFKVLGEIGRDRELTLAVWFNGYIWFVGLVEVLVINHLGKVQFGLSDTRTSLLAAAQLTGIAVGGLASARLAVRGWHRPVFPGLLVMSGLMAVTALVPSFPQGVQVAVLGALFAGIGIAGGIVLIPMESFIQLRPAGDNKGTVIAASNFVAFSGMLVSGPVANLLNRDVTPTTSFALMGGASALAAVLFWFLLTGGIKTILCGAISAVLRLRYRVKVEGAAEVAARGRGGILFLPNHPALVEPFITFTTLFGRFAPRFLADRDQMSRPIIRWIAPRFGARTIPDISKYGDGARAEIDAAVAAVAEGLRRGENWMLYPSGRIYRSYLEDLGGNSAVETVLREAPGTRIVLVRIRGLWGSSFSCASGRYPSVTRALARGALYLLANFLFFTPRRAVTYELHEPADLPRGADRHTMNRYIESFFNENAPHNTYVPFTIYERDGTRTLPEPAGRQAGEAVQVPELVRSKVIAKIREMTGSPGIRDEQGLGRDLGLDSLARMDLVLWLAEEFAANIADPEGLVTVGDALAAACGQALSATLVTVKAPGAKWFTPAVPEPGQGKMITSAFLARARKSPGQAILADQASGVLTYRDVIARTLLLKREVEGLRGEYVGILLPASAAVNVVYLATLFAGKTPVMVNWTVGSRNMMHSLELLNVEKVLTSRAFVRRLSAQFPYVDAAADRFLYLEDMAKAMPLGRKLLAAVRARTSWRELEEALVPGVAAVLFTSGSESLPKAVPLTHENILTNVRDGLGVLHFRDFDRIMAIFPPFHSFGLTCNIVVPLVSGMRAAYHPNPTDGAGIARLIAAYGTTAIFTTPTFLRAILRSAAEGDLDSLALAVTGAEKCPDSLYETAARRCPKLILMEGYGTTECSPVVSVNDYREPVRGTIGKVLQSIEYAIVDRETAKRAARGAQGALLVRGPSVFHGYMGGAPSPFVEFEGKLWYGTGDIVSEDEKGILTFRGRLKRFVKIGGEMISLPAVEAALEKHYVSPDDKAPSIAVEATADETRPELVLFTTKPADRETVNRQLREAGLSALFNVSRVVRLEEMPLLGTGKTDYRALKAILAGDKGESE